MPAVTVSDITLLPRTPVADLLTARPRPVISLTTAPGGFEGEGFPVRRAFMGAPLNAIDPFIMLDQMGEVEYAPGEPKGTPWHPHRGFETVTYMLDGILDHRDSNGGGGRISDGDTQWMTAGGGILHIETPPEFLVASGGLFHGFQLWVNLPRAKQWAPPSYQDIRSSEVKLLASPDRKAHCCDSSPAKLADTKAQAQHRHRSRWCTQRFSQALNLTCRGDQISMRSSTRSLGAAALAPKGLPFSRASSPSAVMAIAS